MASGPQVLLLDEPTFGQDAHTFAEIVDLLREHLAAGGAVLAVTHDAAFLEALDAETVDVGQFRSRPAELPSSERGPRSFPGWAPCGTPRGWADAALLRSWQHLLSSRWPWWRPSMRSRRLWSQRPAL
ncbi:hypothetical protein [Nesterenkonia pannonica]|uniref:hypothetical protein n=1 Tax=Nesterenkonia pannonica TaxID=1548602 RepID=UPI0021649092|nr:hypothetical protein [Nesterenkonia pannonica]